MRTKPVDLPKVPEDTDVIYSLSPILESDIATYTAVNKVGYSWLSEF